MVERKGENDLGPEIKLLLEQVEEYAIFLLDASGKILTWNRGAQRLKGYAASEIIGQHFSIFYTADDKRADKPRRMLETAARFGRVEDESWRLRKDGSRFWGNVVITALRSADGKLQGFGKITRDLTERKMLEDSVEQEREFLDALISALPDVFYAFDRSGRFLRWNSSLENASGFTASEIQAMSAIDFIPDDHKERVETAIAEVFATGRASVEADFLTKNGSRIPFYFTGNRALINGRAVLVGVGMNLAELKRTQAQVLEHEQELSELYEYLQHARIVVRDREDRIIFWNLGAEDFYGWRKEEALGQVSHQLLRTQFPEPLEQIQQALVRAHEWEGELHHVTKQGREVAVVSHWTAHFNSQGEWIGTIESNNEITELKRTESALALARDQLQQQAHQLEQVVAERTLELRNALAELETFSYTLSHDMRAPVRAIGSYAELLQEEYGAVLDSAGRNYLERIYISAGRLDAFIKDVLTYSKLVRNDLPLKSVHLRALINSLLLDRPSLQEPKATVELIEPLLPVLGDETALQQILSNLLENAVKFVSEGKKPHIRISTETQEDHVRLIVQDNGIGIPEQLRERVFALFDRGETHDSTPGTGVGLAIVRKAAAKIGGRVGIDSAPGGGTLFWIQLRPG